MGQITSRILLGRIEVVGRIVIVLKDPVRLCQGLSLEEAEIGHHRCDHQVDHISKGLIHHLEMAKDKIQ